jgi:hypothetical protein
MGTWPFQTFQQGGILGLLGENCGLLCEKSLTLTLKHGPPLLPGLKGPMIGGFQVSGSKDLPVSKTDNYIQFLSTRSCSQDFFL